MADLEELGIRFSQEGYDDLAAALDNISDKSMGSAQAIDTLAARSASAAGAIARMRAEVDRTSNSLGALASVQAQCLDATGRLTSQMLQYAGASQAVARDAANAITAVSQAQAAVAGGANQLTGAIRSSSQAAEGSGSGWSRLLDLLPSIGVGLKTVRQEAAGAGAPFGVLGQSMLDTVGATNQVRSASQQLHLETVSLKGGFLDLLGSTVEVHPRMGQLGDQLFSMSGQVNLGRTSLRDLAQAIRLAGSRAIGATGGLAGAAVRLGAMATGAVAASGALPAIAISPPLAGCANRLAAAP